MYDDWAVAYCEDVARYAEAAERATMRELAATLTIDAPLTAESVTAE